MKRSPLQRKTRLAQVSKGRARKLERKRSRACACSMPVGQHAMDCPAYPAELRRSIRDARQRKPIPQRRATPRRSGRVLNPAFLAFVRTQPCRARGIPGHRCWGRIDPDHQGPHPLGRKADDDTAVALCRGAHTERTDYPGPSSGIFRDWPAEQMQAWKDENIAATRAAFVFNDGRGQDAASKVIAW